MRPHRALAPLLAAACAATDPPPPHDATAADRHAPDAQAPDVPPDAAADVAPAADAAPDVPPPARLRVLFVGNSYTYYNELPSLVVRIGVAAARAGVGPEVQASSVAVGGATLRDHWEAGTAPASVMTGAWDAVVLQGQSVEPALNPAQFRTYALRFGNLATTWRARPVFYATWPRRAGDAVYDQPWSGGTPAALNERLHTAYAQAAAASGGALAPVGTAWLASIARRPALNLYDADGSHPSPAGSWLAACVLYRALAGVPAPPEADSAAPSIPPDDARFLRELAAAP